jgi:DNA-binding MarR family transcriptional regulator
MDDFNISNLNDLIHNRLRLGIMAYLSTAGSADFVTLKNQTKSTDGNLSISLKKLENAKYIKIEKSFIGKKPNTLISITQTGRNEFINYLDALKSLLNQ